MPHDPFLLGHSPLRQPQPFSLYLYTSPRKEKDHMGSGSQSNIIGNQNSIFPSADGMQTGAPPSRLSPCVPNRFESDLRAMTGRPLNWYWKAMWAFVSPLLIISLFIFYLSDYILTGTLQYQAWDATQGQLVTKDYPPHALAVIGLLVASSTMCIPLVALGTFIRNRIKRGGSSPVA